MFQSIIESMAIAIILVAAMLLVGYLNKFQTHWINICHTLGFSSKEKPNVVMAKIAALKALEDELDVSKYSDAKDTFEL